MKQPQPVRAPNGLKVRGRALFKQITGVYVLDAGEMVLLHELCRTVDTIDAIESRVTADGLTISGGRGQIPRAHPLLFPLAEHRKVVSRLVGELALPMPGELVGRRRTPLQKKAAVTELAFS